MYTDEEKRRGLRLYESIGPAEASKATGIPRDTILTWARRDGLVTRALEQSRAARDVMIAQRSIQRELIRTKMIEAITEGLARMFQPYVDYVGKEATKVEYDRPPADAFRSFAQAVAALLRELRTELGETTKSIDVTFRSQINVVARRYGLDPDEVLAEAERIVAETAAEDA